MENKTVEKTPFQQLLHFIFVGMLMTFLNIEMMNLNYILPLIGLLILVSCFRLIKDENRYFKYALITVFFGFLLRIIGFCIDATIFPNLYKEQFVHISLLSSVLKSILAIVFLLNFRKALMEIQKKAGTDFKLKSMKYMIIYVVASSIISIGYVFYLFINGLSDKLAVSPLDFLGIMLFGLIIAITILVKFHKEIKECYTLGEFITINKPKLSNKILTIIMLITLIILVVLANITMGKYAMNWTELKNSEDSRVSQIKSELIDLGFPKEVLADISSEDIKDCQEAISINLDKISDTDETFSMLEDADEEGAKNMLESNLEMYGILVELPSDKNDSSKYKVFNYFKWDKPNDFPGTQCMFIKKPTKIDDYYISINNCNMSKPKGRLIYAKDGTSYEASFYELIKVNFSEDDIYHVGEYKYNGDYIGSFSLPKKVNTARGYMSYILEIEKVPFEIIGGYSYKNSIFQYPVLTAKEDYLKNPSGICQYDNLHVRNIVEE